MSCASCGAALANEARFCPVCGSAAMTTTGAGTGEMVRASAPELVGREIAGRYRIVSKLGEGGMGAVFRGEQISLKRQVAVKLLKPELSADKLLLARFKIEAEAVGKLKHPNTVDIYDFGQDNDGTLFIAMEYIDGRSLRATLRAEAPFAPRRALLIAAQVAASLADAHAHSIVHRDLKPDNVMLQDRGRQRDIARVLDFGIAKLRDDSKATQQAAMTQAGDMLGTPQYMAPEQINGSPVDGRCDIYALGCMIYEMVTGRLPFEAQNVLQMLSKHLMEVPVAPTQRRPDLALPAALDQLVMTAMMKDPAARPRTMELYGEMIADMLAALPAEAVSTVNSSVASVAMAAPTPPPTVIPAPHAGGLRAKLVVAAVAVVGIGIVARVATEKRSSEVPEIAAGVASMAKDPWAGNEPASEPAAKPPEVAPVRAPQPSGTVVDAVDGVRVVVPHGFEVKQGASGLAAGDKQYAIAVTRLVTKLTAPADIAREYGQQNGLVFENITNVAAAGETRSMATFHGMLRNTAVFHIAVGYVGDGYSVVVSLTVPIKHGHDQATALFANELFDKRVLLP